MPVVGFFLPGLARYTHRRVFSLAAQGRRYAVLGRYVKRGVLVFAFVVLVVEGFFVYRWYERYYEPAVAASDGGAAEAAPRNAPVPEEAAKNGGTSSDAAFVHRATGANSRGDYTYIGHPRIDGDPDAVVLAEPSPGRGDDGGAAYGRNIGVWYEPQEQRWAIFNQDLAAVPAGSAFEVVVPPADEGFVHRAAPPNTAGNATYIDDPLLDGQPDAEVSVTQNWNPGGGGGVYNDHPVGALYDGDAGSWFIYNKDGVRMPEGAAFNVAAVLGSAEPAR
jgi:hypothetical protein